MLAVMLVAIGQIALLLALQAAPAAAPKSTPLFKSCKSAGGKVKLVCMSGTRMCVLPFPDAGKPCADKRDCVGRCLYGEGPIVETGTNVMGKCQLNNDPCGCAADVADGKAGPVVCKD